MSGDADYFRLGDWNARCDRCGRKRKGSELQKQWNNLWVCPEHWEPRHPQDFVRTIKENPTPPFVRNPSEVFADICTLEGISGIVGYTVVGCALPDFAYQPEPPLRISTAAIAGILVPNVAVAGRAW